MDFGLPKTFFFFFSFCYLNLPCIILFVAEIYPAVVVLSGTKPDIVL